MVTNNRQADPEPGRVYRSPLRAEQARRTRRGILQAAGECFAESGYAGTSLKAIAQRAGVSVETVRDNGPKAALLLAAYEQAFAGEEGQNSLFERAEFRRILALTDPAAVIDAVATFFTAAGAASARISAALDAAAQSDDGVATIRADLSRRARADAAAGVEFLASIGAPLPGRRARKPIAEELWFLLSAHHYVLLVDDAGWSPARYRDWLRRSLTTLILTRPEAGGS